MTVYGDIFHTNGTITINNGTLNVYGSYIMQNATTNNVGETEYNRCYAKLIMQNEHDKVNISGNLTTHNLYYGASLNYGILTVGGDIWSDGGISASDNYGHKTILNGDKKQTVTLGDYNKFNILVITKPLSNYTFNPEECWNTLIQNAPPVTTPVTTTTTVAATTTIKPVSTTVKTASVPVTTTKPVTSTTIKTTSAPATTTVKPVTSTTIKTTSVPITTTKQVTTTVTTTPTDNTGDLNNDGKVNVADIVLLQKYITKKSDDISKSADLNNDGKVNVFDVVILKRKLIIH
ncbi:MAG: dockerin type I repeat-containing protein [Porcipelethomonas sp.]